MLLRDGTVSKSGKGGKGKGGKECKGGKGGKGVDPSTLDNWMFKLNTTN